MYLVKLSDEVYLENSELRLKCKLYCMMWGKGWKNCIRKVFFLFVFVIWKVCLYKLLED